MADDSRTTDVAGNDLPRYGEKGDDAVTVSVSTAPGEWLVNTSDAVVVPMSMSEVVEALQTHKLTERSLVWRAGMQEWAPVERVPQLKLAARLPLVPPPPQGAPAVRSAAASHPAAAAPPKPRASQPPSSPRSSPPPSRKGTLPFGTPAPVSSPPRPGARSSQPSMVVAAALEPVPAEPREPGVLAVYERPSATISFELPLAEQGVEAAPSDEAEPPRAPRPASTPPHSLVPTTADTEAPAQPRSADLSVVLASQFRQAQRSSKRLVLLSSLGSAAAASLLTFALSRGAPPSPAIELENGVAATQPLPPAPSVAEPVASPPPSAAPSASVAAVAQAPSASPPKPKARRARAWARPPRPPAQAPSASGSPDPNPYDVTLDEDASAEKGSPAPAATHGSGLENNTPPPATTGADTPGF